MKQQIQYRLITYVKKLISFDINEAFSWLEKLILDGNEDFNHVLLLKRRLMEAKSDIDKQNIANSMLMFVDNIEKDNLNLGAIRLYEIKLKNKIQCNESILCFDEEIISIGRSEVNDIVVQDSATSRFHCKIMFFRQALQVEDMDSKHGVYVNGKKIENSSYFNIDDIIVIGQTELIVTSPNGPM